MPKKVSIGIVIKTKNNVQLLIKYNNKTHKFDCCSPTLCMLVKAVVESIETIDKTVKDLPYALPRDR